VQTGSGDDHAARQPAVEIDALHVRRGGRRVLDGLSLTIPAGRVIGLLGPSGSGKTTLMRAIVGVQEIESGEVRVLGKPAGAPAVRSRIGYVTQASALYNDLTARENVRYFARIFGAGAARVEQVLATVRLEGLADRVVSSLSEGERARASLATALVGEPEVLVLDEPTVGLDPVLRRDLWATFRRLARDGATLLISSHVMDEAGYCEELLLMRDGGILARGAPDDLRDQTHTQDLAEAFLRLIEQASEPGRGANHAAALRSLEAPNR
jgi:ABC-2 type transport system ATP-binding protein